MDVSKEQVASSLRVYKGRRDSLLHDDESTFEHNLDRFVKYLDQDPLAADVLAKLPQGADVNAWWSAATGDQLDTAFPSDSDSELALRVALLRSTSADPNLVFKLGVTHHQRKRDGWVSFYKTLVLQPFFEEFSHRLAEAANLATPEARVVQAVPLERIPSPREVRLFLSHKTVDKPLVYRYYNALRTLGFSPWLDEADMPAGSNLERAVLQGFEESCAAVFFITQNFLDEKYLAAEVDYAVMQKRKKDRKFAIITLRYANAAPVPGLLQPYIYKDVENDLDGFDQLVRALPIELGPVRWKANVL